MTARHEKPSLTVSDVVGAGIVAPTNTFAQGNSGFGTSQIPRPSAAKVNKDLDCA